MLNRGRSSLRPEWWVRASSGSIIRSLLIATALSAFVTVVGFGLGFRSVAVPFLLATAIGFGLIVVTVTWKFVTEKFPDSS